MGKFLFVEEKQNHVTGVRSARLGISDAKPHRLIRSFGPIQEDVAQDFFDSFDGVLNLGELEYLQSRYASVYSDEQLRLEEGDAHGIGV